MTTAEWAGEYTARYREILLGDVVPFWMRYAFGSADGAIDNCLDDEGRKQSSDRFLWSQGRALWTFSALYRRVEPRAEWLAAAGGIYRYLRGHGRDARGRWMFRLDAGGTVLEEDTSIYVDGFVMNGLAEYFLATGEAGAKALALETAAVTRERLRSGEYLTAPYAIPSGLKALGIRMIFSKFFYDMGETFGDAALREEAVGYAHEVLDDFYVPEEDLVHEYIGLDGRPGAMPEGRVCIPGHVIETMWFLISIFERNGERERIPECCRLIRRHLEVGWDEEYGGLRLAIDAGGAEEVAWQKADCKPWWVQAEALVATAYALSHTGEDWCRAWHDRVFDYAIAHYPQPAGEWTQWLDRQGNTTGTAALPVKDPFHLPRALMELMGVFNRDG
ncbi:MAG: AGE family epimerase/isomerase [Armatimonadota bacterium]